jgi:hypothetical protein
MRPVTMVPQAAVPQAAISQGAVPQAAADAGLGGRFRYWTGRSGIRHLFTSIDPCSLDDFPDAVALIADGEKVVWAGEVRAAPHAMPAQSVFVHLLARSEKTRDLVAGDLCPVRPAWRSLFTVAGGRQAAASRSASLVRFASGMPSSARCSAVLST